jgi:CheY-like chemotaxis protein
MAELHQVTRSILVVEDDPAVGELLRTLLSDVAGWGATVVHDAAQAREVIRQVKIDALVLDVNLPGLSGFELLALLCDDPEWHEPPVILVSAAEQPGIREALQRGDAVRFIKKPFDVDEVIEALRSALPA